MHLLDLFETRSASLYHGTNFYSAAKIIEDNTLLAKTDHDLPSIGPVMGVSLTRNRHFAINWSFIAFEFDRDRLAQKHRLIPYNYWHRGKDRSQSDSRNEAEEFIIGPVPHIDHYLLAIYVTKLSWRHVEKLNGPHEGFYDPLRQHPLLRIV